MTQENHPTHNRDEKVPVEQQPSVGAVGDDVLQSQLAETQRVLYRFALLPKRYCKARVMISFLNDQPFQRTATSVCEALGLPVGDTISARFSINKLEDDYCVFASSRVAEQLLNLPTGQIVLANAVTIFGTGWIIEELPPPEDPCRVTTTYEGLSIVKISEDPDKWIRYELDQQRVDLKTKETLDNLKKRMAAKGTDSEAEPGAAAGGQSA
jgi:hypothetical protein